MKPNRSHIAKGIFLLLLVAAVFLSSAGIYASSVRTHKEIAKKDQSETSSKQEQVSASPAFEAVVVSLISPDFTQEIIFHTIDFSPLVEKVLLTSNRSIVSEKYFRTLFTHFICPNAP